MDRKDIEFSESFNLSINVIMGTMYSRTPSSINLRSITIFHDNETARDEVPKVSIPLLMVEVPRPFPYKSQKTVPWDYHCNYTHQTAAIDLNGVGGITRSGRCYAPDMAKKVIPEKLSMPVKEEHPSKEKERLFREKKGKDKEVLESTSKPITEKEACEFLKFIKHSKYSVIEQLNETPTRISLLSLFQNSEVHREALLKALGEAYVNLTISIDEIDHLIRNIMVDVCITFTDDEIPLEGRDNTKALHITIKCKSHVMPQALLDNGSSLNVMPMSTLSRLSIDLSNLKKSQMVVDRKSVV